MTDRIQMTGNVTGSDAPKPEDGAPAPEATEKPKWLPDKFWNAEKKEANFEALATSYGELEKKQGSKPPADDKKPETKTADGDAQNEAAEKVISDAGLNYEEFQNEFYRTGELSKESRQKIMDATKLPEAMIDSYLAGVQLQAREFANSIVGNVGGPEQYARMQQWAQESLSADEIKTFNDSVNSGDYNRALAAVKALRSDYITANGQEPKLVGGKADTASGSDRYESWAQVTKDMGKPEYKSDASFRAKVAAKLDRSPSLK